MMKRIKLLLFALLLTGTVMAQSNIRWSNFLLDTYSINPASVDKYFANLKGGVQLRNQWYKLEGAPYTGSIFATSYVDAINSQLGLHLMLDKIGYTHAMDINPTYAFNINGGNASSVWVLNFGIGGHAQSFYYDTDNIIFENDIMQNDLQYINEIYETTWSFNFDVGAEFAFTLDDRKEFLFGVVAQNFLSYWKSDLTPFSNTNFGYAQAKLPVFPNQDILGGVSIIHSKNQYAPNKYSDDIYQWEFDLKYRFYFDDSRSLYRRYLSPGVIFRTKRSWLPNVRELGVLLEYEWLRFFTVAGTYEYPLSSLTNAANTWGTFELIFIVRIGTPSTRPYNINDKGKKFNCKIPSGKSHDYGVY